MKFRNGITVDEVFERALISIEADPILLYGFNKILLDKDLYTHSYGVGKVTTQMAIALGFDDDVIQGLCIAALLHDIGKTYIPKAILYKTGKLTDEDVALIRKHPSAGYNMLKGCTLPEEYLEVILHHHETLEGKGYPDGISNMSYYSQIVNVSDIFNALTEARCYRSAFSVNNALEYMKMIGGINQDLVTVLSEVIEE